MPAVQDVPAPPSGTAIPVPPSGSIVAVSSGEIPPPPSGSIVAVQSAIPPPPSGTAIPAPVVSTNTNDSFILSPAERTGTHMVADPNDVGADVRIGNLVPNAIMPALAWLQKNINDPLNKMAAAGSQAGRELGREMVTGWAPDKEVEQLPGGQTALGIAGGVGSVAGGAVADPRNWPFFASGAARPMLQKIISGGFAAQMGKGTIDTAQTLSDNWDKLTPEQRWEMGTQAGLSAVMTAAAGTHALTGGEVAPKSLDESKLPGTVTPPPPSSDVAESNQTVTPKIVTRISDEAAVTPGPGAQNLGTDVKESGSDIAQLGAAMKTGAMPNVADRMKAALDDATGSVGDAAAGAVNSAKDAVTSRLDRVTAAGSALWDSYSNPPDWTDFKDSRGKWDYALQRSSHEAMQFAKDIKAGIPDDLTREAIVNYIQAGGDDSVLQQRAEASDGDLRKGYEAARNLTNDQKIKAQNISNYFDAKLQQARDSGMLSAGVENYVNQIWDRANPVTQKLQADIDYGTLRTNPSLLKQRVFDSYFDGEQAGFAPKNKDIGYLVTAYDESFNKATAGRAFIKSMLDGDGKDGRPLLVANGDRAIPVPASDTGSAASLITPKFIGEKYADYKPIDHPALRKWTWIGKDSNGQPIYQNGDLWVHPDAYGELKNNLSNSWLRQNPVTRTVMDVGQKIKGSMLSYSLFHQVQEGVHAIGHGVNPFDVGKIIDFDAPDQKTLIEHGLQVSNVRAQSEFLDGDNAAYAYRVPVIGRAAQRYSDYLFNDYIPNLKMKTGLDILDRNRQRYASKYTPDQIAELSAKQANAAYGELNYRQMGRNKTLQDAFRLISLAPDFTEARGRFVAQALRPEGAEQRMALLRLTAVMYGAARVTNMALNNGNPRIDKPFAATFHGRDYSLRSVVGDAAHLISDPRSFLYYRLNPTTTKPLIQYLTGVDEFGRKRATGQLLSDTLKGWSPIAVQKWIKDPQGFSPLDSLLTSLGVQNSRATPSDKALRQQFTSGALPMQKLQQMQSNGDLSADQVQQISAPVKRRADPALVKSFKLLQPEQALDAWSSYSADQQQQLTPSLRRLPSRINQMDRTPMQKQALKARVVAALAAK